MIQSIFRKRPKEKYDEGISVLGVTAGQSSSILFKNEKSLTLTFRNYYQITVIVLFLYESMRQARGVILRYYTFRYIH